MVTKSEIVEVPELDLQMLYPIIRGISWSSLIQNNFSQQEKDLIRDKQTGKKVVVRKHKDPKEIFEQKKYYTKDGKLGIPGNAIKAAMVAAARISKDKMTEMRQAFHVIGDVIPFSKHSKPVMKEDCFPVNLGGRNYTVRAEIEEWELPIKIQYNANFVSAGRLINLLSLAGFHCGLLDYRPNGRKCSGGNGLFELVFDDVKKNKTKPKG